jgi:hypothetical protein
MNPVDHGAWESRAVTVLRCARGKPKSPTRLGPRRSQREKILH